MHREKEKKGGLEENKIKSGNPVKYRIETVGWGKRDLGEPYWEGGVLYR